jgi:putative chitinase
MTWWWPFKSRANASGASVPQAEAPAKVPPALFSAEFLAAVFPRCDAVAWVPALSAAMRGYHITSRWRMAHFLAQIGHESAGLTRLVEDMTYSTPGRICAMWPKRFLLEADARPYVRQPQALAEKVYGMRPDLGNDQPGDGFKYRARGLIQITGKANYTEVAAALGWGGPEAAIQRLETRGGAALGSAHWWASRGLNEIADQGGLTQLEAITRRVNGRLNGLSDRRDNLVRIFAEFDRRGI